MDFFSTHSEVQIIFLALFPRLTLLFGSFASGGVLWWLGWLFTPRFLVAFLSLRYWDTNPVLVTIAWVLAFCGTSVEVIVPNYLISQIKLPTPKRPKEPPTPPIEI